LVGSGEELAEDRVRSILDETHERLPGELVLEVDREDVVEVDERDEPRERELLAEARDGAEASFARAVLARGVLAESAELVRAERARAEDDAPALDGDEEVGERDLPLARRARAAEERDLAVAEHGAEDHVPSRPSGRWTISAKIASGSCASSARRCARTLSR